MKSPTLFLAIALFAATSANAQKASIQSTTIPLNEAEQHLIEHNTPTYPPIAKLAGVEGAVRLTLEVNQSGEVVRVIESSGPPLLSQSASDTAEHYRYRPFVINGELANVRRSCSDLPIARDNSACAISRNFDINSVLIEYTDSSVHVRISGNGLVEYEGRDTGVVEGKHKRQIGKEEVQHLLEAFRKADFFSLNDDYSVAATDARKRKPVRSR